MQKLNEATEKQMYLKITNESLRQKVEDVREACAEWDRFADEFLM